MTGAIVAGGFCLGGSAYAERGVGGRKAADVGRSLSSCTLYGNLISTTGQVDAKQFDTCCAACVEEFKAAGSRISEFAQVRRTVRTGTIFGTAVLFGVALFFVGGFLARRRVYGVQAVLALAAVGVAAAPAGWLAARGIEGVVGNSSDDLLTADSDLHSLKTLQHLGSPTVPRHGCREVIASAAGSATKGSMCASALDAYTGLRYPYTPISATADEAYRKKVRKDIATVDVAHADQLLKKLGDTVPATATPDDVVDANPLVAAVVADEAGFLADGRLIWPACSLLAAILAWLLAGLAARARQRHVNQLMSLREAGEEAVQ